MIRKEVIKYFVLTIDPSKLGYNHYKLYLKLQNIPTEKELGLVNFLTESKNTTWVASLRGNFDLVVSVWARDVFEFQGFYLALKDRFGVYVYDERLVLITQAPAFNRSYFLKQGEKVELPYGRKKGTVEIDKLDSEILSLLTNNARQSYIDIAKQLDVNPDTARYRIAKPKKAGVITGSRIALNNKAINRDYTLVLLDLQNFNKNILRSLELFSKNFDSILYFVNCIDSHNAEIEAEVSSDEEFDTVMRSFRNRFFNHIKSYTTLEVTKEHKLDFYPF